MLAVPPGQAADPGAETETGEKILPNEREEGGDAGGVGWRASERQEHEEPGTETTAGTQGRRPRLQTSKLDNDREGGLCAQHPSPAGAGPRGAPEATTAQSPDALKEWGCMEGWGLEGPGGRAWKSREARHPSDDSHWSVLLASPGWE